VIKWLATRPAELESRKLGEGAVGAAPRSSPVSCTVSVAGDAASLLLMRLPPVRLLNRSGRVNVRRARPEHCPVGLNYLNAAVGALIPVGMGFDRVADP
jgi:hypothetical protein